MWKRMRFASGAAIGLVVIGCIWLSLAYHSHEVPAVAVKEPVLSSPHVPVELAGNDAINAFFFGNATDGLSWASAHVLENIEIDAQGSGSAFEINDTTLYLVIRNCTFFNATGTSEGAGMKLRNCSNIHVTNCSIYNNIYGILADAVNNSFFSLNFIRDNFYGAQVTTSQNNTITSNTLRWNVYETIRLDGSNNNTLEFNVIIDNSGQGMMLSYSDLCIVKHNTLINNSENGIYVFWSGHATVSENNITQYNNDAGIYLYAGFSSTVEGNLMAGTGVVLDGFTLPAFRSHSILASNKVNGKDLLYYVDQQSLSAPDFVDPGQIILVNCTNASMTGLTITNTTFGIMLFSSSGNSITGNTITHNMHAIGITYFSQYNTIVSNNLTFNRRSSVNLHAVSSNIVGYNNASYSGNIGLRVVASTNNTIFGNDASNSSGYGIYLSSDSSTNTIYINKFAGNAWSDTACQNEMNAWDNGTAGNYYGDYTSRYPSATNDNITWNTPYLINWTLASFDEHPLVWPFTFYMKPVANFTANTTVIIARQPVAFTFTGNEGYAPATFQWDFGDGTANSTEMHPVHVYANPGNYTTTLTVNDSQGQTSTFSIPSHVDVIEDLIPEALFTADSMLVVAGQQVQFTFTGSIGNGPATFSWDFGDGTAPSPERNPLHLYSSPGNFTIALVVTDANNNASMLSIPSYIDVMADQLPVASFMTNATDLIEGWSVQFLFTGQQGNQPSTCEWDFGDGSPVSSAQHPVHQYVMQGSYTPLLTVRDADGDVSVSPGTIVIHVHPDAIPVPGFVMNATAVVSGQAVAFSFTGTTGNEPATFQWDFGDGSANSTVASPVHVFTVPGTFTITLTVLDLDHDSATFRAMQPVSVAMDEIPAASFSVLNVTVFVGQDVHFTFTGTGGNDPCSYFWMFGNVLQNSTCKDPVHRFNAPGQYTVVLQVRDIDGDTDTFVMAITAIVPGADDGTLEAIIIIAAVAFASVVALAGYKRRSLSRRGEPGRAKEPAALHDGQVRPEWKGLVVTLMPPEILELACSQGIEGDLASEIVQVASIISLEDRAGLIAEYMKEIKEFDHEF